MEDDGVEGFGSEEVGDRLEDGALAVLLVQGPHRVGVDVGDEPDEGALLLPVVRVVVDLLDEMPDAEAGARESRIAPEGPRVGRMDLDDQPHRLVLVEDLLEARQVGDVGDPRVEVRGHGDDDVGARELRVVGAHDDWVTGPVDRAHGAVQPHHRVPEVGGHEFGDLLHAADDAAVEDEVVVDEVGERSRRGGHEHGLERRERCVGFREHASGDEHADVLAREFVGRLLAQPVVEGDRVELLRVLGIPGTLCPDARGEVVEDADEAVHLRLPALGDGERVTGVDGAGAVGGEEDPIAVAVPGEGAQPEFVDEVEDRGLVG
ncbi:Uncharacterised protein [Mycobacteroides abscessus subsp. abscessus]|nr:Uncharacterised protein [Mycobacteroides abscessus subsp. abscessus]